MICAVVQKASRGRPRRCPREFRQRIRLDIRVNASTVGDQEIT